MLRRLIVTCQPPSDPPGFHITERPLSYHRVENNGVMWAGVKPWSVVWKMIWVHFERKLYLSTKTLWASSTMAAKRRPDIDLSSLTDEVREKVIVPLVWLLNFINQPCCTKWIVYRGDGCSIADVRYDWNVCVMIYESPLSGFELLSIIIWFNSTHSFSISQNPRVWY